MGLADAPRSGKSLAARCKGGRFIEKEVSRANRSHRGFIQTADRQTAFELFVKKESG